MSDIGSTSHSSPTGIMHHQIKLDVFLIKGYQLISNGEVLELPELLNSTISPNQQSPISLKPLDERHMQYFQSLSQLYDALVTIVPLDEQSNVPKSNIELFQRFQQILKEILLSYDVSPYNRYFLKLDENNWKIRDNVDDPLWQVLSFNIDKVYDKTTGLITPLRRQGKSTTASARESPVLAPRRKSVVNTITSPDFSLSQVDNKLEQVSRVQDQDYYSNVQANANQSPNSQFDWPRAMTESTNGKPMEQINEEEQPARKRVRKYITRKDSDVVGDVLQLQNTPPVSDQDKTSSLPEVTIRTYEKLLQEKDRHITDLKNDLEEQRKEIIWLKKLIMEDMKYLRSTVRAGNNQ
ncbi:Gcr2 [Kluyveromyces lactis]|nr:Gcr2 [Kluyveromyces lactis]